MIDREVYFYYLLDDNDHPFNHVEPFIRLLPPSDALNRTKPTTQ